MLRPILSVKKWKATGVVANVKGQARKQKAKQGGVN